ncbi:hypothetical protein EVA_13114 [gut metagenome]|uniref:Uncharacterized protein n=1 Tax=gut metagenome TaxID=749906 RepID=J9CFI4_9ZZZZ
MWSICAAASHVVIIVTTRVCFLRCSTALRRMRSSL